MPNSQLPRVAVVLTSQAEYGEAKTPGGGWYSELATPYYAFEDAGCDIAIFSIKGGPAVIDPLSQTLDWTNADTQRMDADPKAQAKLKETRPVSELKSSDFDILLVPGGTATMWDLPTSQSLTELIETAANGDEKIVATLCHGVSCLVEAKTSAGEPVVKGMTLTSFTDSEEETMGATEIVPFLLETRLRDLGANFEGGDDWSNTVKSDDWLVTGQNPQSGASLAKAALEAFSTRSTAAA